MYSFKNDYSEGAHPDVLNALVDNNMNQEEGYGLDSYSEKAAAIIGNILGSPDSDIHFLSGGTQTNLLAISSFLRPHEACISASSAHIATHETGAIEATGHKIITVDTYDGKLTPDLIAPVLTEHHFEHMVKPRLVYISNSTELGTVYSKLELKDLHQYCYENSLLLYIDGARLGSAIMVKEAGLSLKDIHDLSDAFFIGGTKNGALMGEALVIRNNELKKDMRYMIKQRGALLSKGRVLGVQFEALFQGNLYFDLASHANNMAQLLTKKLKSLGCSFLIDSPTNQIFPIMSNNVIDKLSIDFSFYIWKSIDKDNSAIRLITSWATPESAVKNFITEYEKALK
jgi:threonine aldolase